MRHKKDSDTLAAGEVFCLRVINERAENNGLVNEQYLAQEILSQKGYDQLLKQEWKSTIQACGEYRAIRYLAGCHWQELLVFSFECIFKRGTRVYVYCLDKDLKVAGLWNIGDVKTSTPEKPETAVERQVLVVDDANTIKGRLMFPAGHSTQLACVVLVHGSGAHDADETVGVQKPFRDIAYGMCGQGIASLRYDSRAYVMANKTGTADVTAEETINDAVAALRVASEQPEIDKNRLFLLGHSLGGYLLPEIACRYQKTAGLIFLAANSRSLLDTLVRQLKERLQEIGSADTKAKQELCLLMDDALKVKSGTYERPAFMGAPVAWWLDLERLGGPKALEALNVPCLLMRGMKDKQVGMTDFEEWKRALANRSGVTCRQYPDCGHLFLERDDSIPLATIAVPTVVSRDIITDIAQWIKGQATTVATLSTP